MQQMVEFGALIPKQWPVTPVDDWTDQLKSICGSFNSRRVECKVVTGSATIMDAGGLELAQVANDLDIIHRDFIDIKRDYGENLFLLLQLEGTCGIEQRGRQSIIAPGDCILVDSSAPSIFHFGGHFSNHLSVHLPRQLIVAGKAAQVEISRRLEAEDPMSAMLRALVAKLIRTDAQDKRAQNLRELLFSATRQAFAMDEDPDQSFPVDSPGGRLEIVQILIDRHLTDEHLTPQWLADKVGISLRTLQDDFSALGTTATSLIRLRRLHLVHEQLLQMKNGPSAPTIAEVAYSAGFNDISYFNRCFRKAFDCSPKDILQH
ncbi:MULTISPECIES: helix-turn-helix domain-containing protein [Rhizobium]|uniref:helix-turn-helix domain-containing protein n=1 Tax=Rhizobium TaxID=379 RepID=UPI001FE28A1F|nr:helix-turn-helix domain-containing protein [Rhizobium leguminosarum]